MTGRIDFTELGMDAMNKRKATQQQNLAARDDIAVALRASHSELTPWKAVPPDEEIVGNVTKRLNVSCEDSFRLHLVIHDGGRVLFPKLESAEPFTAPDSAEALREIARRFALHRMPDETVVVRRAMQAR